MATPRSPVHTCDLEFDLGSPSSFIFVETQIVKLSARSVKHMQDEGMQEAAQ